MPGYEVRLTLPDGTLQSAAVLTKHDPRRDGGVDAKASASDHMGHIVEVNGTEASVGAYHAIYVQGLTK